MSRLLPTDVPERDPAAQLAELAGGRLLVRHRDGLSLLADVGRQEAADLLDRVDGRRTAAEIARATPDPDRSMALLRSFAGELVRVRGSGPPTSGRQPGAEEAVAPPEGSGPAAGAAPAPGLRLAVLVSGPGGEALAEELRRSSGVRIEVHSLRPEENFGAGPAPGLDALSSDADRWVVALEGASYGRLLALQDACLRRGLSPLFVTFDPDGVRIGPTVRPERRTACLGCSLLAALAPAGLGAGEALAAGSALRTIGLHDLLAGAPDRPVLRRLAVRVAREAATPQRSVNGLALLSATGAERTLPVPRRPDCPACSPGAEVPQSDPLRAEPASEPLHVGILGGGTAGCLVALAIRARRPEARVTLIRDPDTPPIGVGEATTPLVPQFLHADLGIGAEELFREVRPTFKLGIRFDWGPERNGRSGFPYPFGPLRTLEAATWDGDLDACSLWAVLMAAGAVPVRAEEGSAGRWTAELGTEVAYHLDNRRLAAFLERLARVRGVEIIEARVVGVERTAEGAGQEIVSLVGEGGRRFLFDLYVDCSGFRSLLMGDALGSPFVDYGASLFTDRAVVGAVPRAPGAPMPPFTRARTLEAGWSWSIPQPESDHVGSVYSSAFSDAERAARELATVHPGLREAGGLRELSFRPGRRRHFWRGNVVALGNAYGFVEPLESTALHLLIRQIGLLVRHLPGGAGGARGADGDGEREDREALRERLNRRVGDFWDYVRWFLALHFRFNRRLDTPFWRACRDGVDVSAHGELLERFRNGGPLAYQDDAARFDYPDPLWGPEGVDTLLLGQGVLCRLPEPPVPEPAWRAETERCRRFAATCLPQADLLARLPEHPEVLGSLESGFRSRGRAF